MDWNSQVGSVRFDSPYVREFKIRSRTKTRLFFPCIASSLVGSFEFNFFRYSLLLNSSRLASMVDIALVRLALYFEKRSCWRPDQILVVSVSSCCCAETVTRIGYLSTQFSTTSATGKTLLRASSAVLYSCFPPSQFRE